MLTKKKCKEALEQLDLNCWGCEYACDMSDDKPCVLKEIIGKLIEEHFDNPPLKFEELEEGMWVWCGGSYSQITELSNFGKIKLVYFDCDSVRFKEGCFYRKQVE